jgi:hypothetical protein
MQVEHITLGGNTALRDTNIILPETVHILKGFQVKEGVKTLPFPKTAFTVKITATKEGAIFNIMKGKDIALMNVCCFEEEHTPMLLSQVRHLHDLMKFGEPRLPVLSNWMYSLVINPFALSREEFQIAGEVELYIYYSLYIARQK